MKAEDIIEGLNRHIEEKRKGLGYSVKGHLILQKTNKPHPIMKAYKEYNYFLWFINNGKKHIVCQVSMTDRVLTGQEDVIIRKMNIELCKTIFSFIGSFMYDKIIKGEYGRNQDE